MGFPEVIERHYASVKLQVDNFLGYLEFYCLYAMIYNLDFYSNFGFGES